MNEPGASRIPPSQDIDDEYTFKLLGILSRAGEETARGWSKIGLLINFDYGFNHSPSRLFTYATVIWKGKAYHEWISEQKQSELTTAALHWIRALMEADFKYWTSMFLGINSDKHFVWIPNYDAGHGPWKIDFRNDNWSVMEKGLKEL